MDASALYDEVKQLLSPRSDSEAGSKATLRIGILRRTQKKAERSAAEVEIGPEFVLQVAQPRFRQRLQLVPEQRKGRRPRLGLRHVANPDAAAFDGGWRMPFECPLQETIQVGGCDTPVPRAFGGKNGRKKPRQPFAALGRKNDEGCAGNLRQETVALLAKCADRTQLCSDQIPFVDGENNGAAFAYNEIGNGEVLLFEGLRRVDQDHHAFGEADGVQGARDRHLFQRLARYARLFAEARRIVQQNLSAVPIEFCRDRIARDSRLGSRERSFAAEQPVEQRRFADIGASDDGEFQRLCRIVCGYCLRGPLCE